MRDTLALVAEILPELTPGQQHRMRRQLLEHPQVLDRAQALVPVVRRRSKAIRDQADRLLGLPPAYRSREIQKSRRHFLNPELAREFIERSAVTVFHHPSLAVEMARHGWEISVALVGRSGTVPWGRRGIYDLQARSLAYLGNAYRVSNRFQEAAAALDDALLRYFDGSGDELLLAEILSLRVSLLNSLRRFNESLLAAERATVIYAEHGESHLVGKILVKNSLAKMLTNNLHEARRIHEHAWDFLDEDLEPIAAAVALLNRAICVYHIESASEAEQLLAEYPHLDQLLGPNTSGYRHRAWLNAHFQLDRGAFPEAEESFLVSRELFRLAGNKAAEGYITLDLGIAKGVQRLPCAAYDAVREGCGQLRAAGHREVELLPLLRLLDQAGTHPSTQLGDEIEQAVDRFYCHLGATARQATGTEDRTENHGWDNVDSTSSSPLRAANIGRAFHYLRQDRGLRQGEVAERAGITRPMLSAYEKGRKAPNLKTLTQLLGALKADFADLQGALSVLRVGSHRPSPAPRPAQPDPQESRYLADLTLAGNLASSDPAVAAQDLLVNLRHWARVQSRPAEEA